jgi:hypothetical protein
VTKYDTWGQPPNTEWPPPSLALRLFGRLMRAVGITVLICLGVGCVVLFTVGVSHLTVAMGLVPFLLLCLLFQGIGRR